METRLLVGPNSIKPSSQLKRSLSLSPLSTLSLSPKPPIKGVKVLKINQSPSFNSTFFYHCFLGLGILAGSNGDGATETAAAAGIDGGGSDSDGGEEEARFREGRGSEAGDQRSHSNSQGLDCEDCPSEGASGLR